MRSDEDSEAPNPAARSQGSKTSFFARLRSWVVAHPIIAAILLAGVATAAITITYTNTSDVTTSSVDPPIQYSAGDDAGPSTLTDYVSAYAISTNKTYITATVNGVPEANLTIDSLFKITNTDDSSHSVTLSTSQVSAAKVTTYKIAIHDVSDDSLEGILDLTAGSPSTTFTMPASDVFYGKLYLVLDTGTTPGDLSSVNPSITLTFT